MCAHHYYAEKTVLDLIAAGLVHTVGHR